MAVLGLWSGGRFGWKHVGPVIGLVGEMVGIAVGEVGWLYIVESVHEVQAMAMLVCLSEDGHVAELPGKMTAARGPAGHGPCNIASDENVCTHLRSLSADRLRASRYRR